MAGWNRDSAVQALATIGLRPEQEREIDHAVQLVLPGGTKVNIYKTGRVVPQGPASDERRRVEALFSTTPPSAATSAGAVPALRLAAPAAAAPAPAPSTTPAPSVASESKVFIVYGHDKASRDELELLLLRLKIQPVILSNLAPDGKTIIEALMANAEVSYAVVLLTPDDEGHPSGKPDLKKFRARQNVVLELGMFLMKLGRERVAILYKGTLEKPSDIDGLIYIPYTNAVSEAKNKLAAALQKAGFFIDIEALSAE